MEGSADLFRPIIHYSFHFLVPFVFAKLFWKENWWKAALIMVGTILIDLDHPGNGVQYPWDACGICAPISLIVYLADYGHNYSAIT